MYEGTKFKIIYMKPERDIIIYVWNRIVLLVGNVNENLKKKSNFVTDSNDNDGVAKVIDKLIIKTIKIQVN